MTDRTEIYITYEKPAGPTVSDTGRKDITIELEPGSFRVVPSLGVIMAGNMSKGREALIPWSKIFVINGPDGFLEAHAMVVSGG